MGWSLIYWGQRIASGRTTLENSFAVSLFHIHFTIRTSNFTLRYYPREAKVNVHIKTTNVLKIFIHNHLKWKQDQHDYIWEAEEGESGVQGHFLLHSKIMVSLGWVPISKKLVIISRHIITQHNISISINIVHALQLVTDKL